MCVCISGGKKCSFFGKFGVPCFLETPALRFCLLPYYRRTMARQILNHILKRYTIEGFVQFILSEIPTLPTFFSVSFILSNVAIAHTALQIILLGIRLVSVGNELLVFSKTDIDAPRIDGCAFHPSLHKKMKFSFKNFFSKSDHNLRENKIYANCTKSIYRKYEFCCFFLHKLWAYFNQTNNFKQQKIYSNTFLA